MIRTILEKDRWWSAYALADLEPRYFEYSSWFVPSYTSTDGMVLVYSEFEMPVVLSVGTAAGLSPVFDELRELLRKHPRIYFVIRPDILPLLQGDYGEHDRRPMLRMVLEPDRFALDSADEVDWLEPDDLESVTALFADGNAAGEAPDFFIPAMLGDGIYYGVREGEDLAAVAGTHVLAPSEGVAGLGNIYTHRDRRNRGLGGRVTAAVVREALRRNLTTIVLNVNQENAAAIHLYEKLGFRAYCPYFEIIASPIASGFVSH